MLYIILSATCFFSCKQTYKPSPLIATGNIAKKDTATINTLNLYAYSITRNNPDSAIIYLQKTLQLSESINYEFGKGEALYFMGVAYFYKYQYDTAIFFHEKAYDLFKKVNNLRGMAQAQYSLSYDYSLKQNLPKSIECMENAKKIVTDLKDYKKICNCIDGLIYLNKQLKNKVKTDSLISELIVAAEKSGDKKKLAGSYNILGNHYIDQAYMNMAIDAFYKALKLSEETGDSIEIANALGNTALANQKLKEYKIAIDYYQRQESILISLNDLYQLSNTYEGLGECYNGINEYAQGLNYHLKSYQLRQNMSYQIAISNSLYNISNTYFRMKDSTEKSLYFIKKAYAIDTRLNNINGLMNDYLLLGKIYTSNKNYQDAIRNLEKSLSMAKRYENTEVIVESSGMLSQVYSHQEKFKDAYSNLLLHNEANDSLRSSENIRHIVQLEMQHTFEDRQKELDNQRLQEKIRYETKLKRNRLIFVFSIFIGLLVITFGIFMFINYRKSKRADKEKEALLKEIHHRVKNNLMVISSLLNLQSGTLTDDKTKSAVRESQSRVKSMALIHQLLYQSEMFTRIDFPMYLEQLMSSLQSAYCKPGMNIKYRIQADDIKLDIDTAIPLGLITNELATNAYKYAFADSREGIIELQLRKVTESHCKLSISDNGVGLPYDFDLENSNTLGLKLVKILTKQLKAKINYEISGGTEFQITFSKIHNI